MSPLATWQIIGLCLLSFSYAFVYFFNAEGYFGLLAALIMGWALVQMKKSKAKKSLNSSTLSKN
jgi:hypothetical protein